MAARKAAKRPGYTGTSTATTFISRCWCAPLPPLPRFPLPPLTVSPHPTRESRTDQCSPATSARSGSRSTTNWRGKVECPVLSRRDRVPAAAATAVARPAGSGTLKRSASGDGSVIDRAAAVGSSEREMGRRRTSAPEQHVLTVHPALFPRASVSGGATRGVRRGTSLAALVPGRAHRRWRLAAAGIIVAGGLVGDDQDHRARLLPTSGRRSAPACFVRLRRRKSTARPVTGHPEFTDVLRPGLQSWQDRPTCHPRARRGSKSRRETFRTYADREVIDAYRNVNRCFSFLERYPGVVRSGRDRPVDCYSCRK